MFVMVMMLDISHKDCNFLKLKGDLEALSTQIGMQINIMHEDIFHSMHRI